MYVFSKITSFHHTFLSAVPNQFCTTYQFMSDNIFKDRTLTDLTFNVFFNCEITLLSISTVKYQKRLTPNFF